MATNAVQADQQPDGPSQIRPLAWIRTCCESLCSRPSLGFGGRWHLLAATAVSILVFLGSRSDLRTEQLGEPGLDISGPGSLLLASAIAGVSFLVYFVAVGWGGLLLYAALFVAREPVTFRLAMSIWLAATVPNAMRTLSLSALALPWGPSFALERAQAVPFIDPISIVVVGLLYAMLTWGLGTTRIKAAVIAVALHLLGGLLLVAS